MQKTIHFALFLFIVTGMLFTGCGTSTETIEEDMGGSLEESLQVDGGEEGTTGEDEEESTEEDFSDYDGTLEAPEDEVSDESAYEDGSYTEVGGYTSPAGAETVSVTLVLEGGVVQSVSIGNLATNEASKQYQNLFAEGISSLVVGKSIDSLGAVGAVNGASLTGAGFNAAVEAIRADAEASA